MKLQSLALAATFHALAADEQAAEPMQKVVALITSIQKTVIRDGEQANRAYHEYYEWCDDEHFDITAEIKTLTQRKGQLEATISQAESDQENADTKVGVLSEQISTDEKKLAAAKKERKREREIFEASEDELMQAVDMLGRATGVLEKEMSKGAAFVQGGGLSANLQEVLLGLSAIVDAAGLAGEEDGKRLMSLVQMGDGTDGDDTGAPSASAYENHSGGIIETMDNLKDKAEDQLRKTRKEEGEAQHNFDMMELALKNQIKDNNKNFEEEKVNMKDAGKAKAEAEGNLVIANKALALAHKKNDRVQKDCIQAAADHEDSIKGREQELAVLANAKKILLESTQGAAAFLQTAASQKHIHFPSQHLRARRATSILQVGDEIVALVKRVGQEQQAAEMVQLASKISASMKYYSNGSGRGGPFTKVRGLIQDLIAKLEQEASDDAQEKAYCDKELHETGERKEELSNQKEGLTAKIDESIARSEKLKGEVRTLQAELAELERSQTLLDKERTDAKTAYDASHKDLQQALNGVQSAMSMLRSYYGTQGSEAEGTALLQESDGDEDEQPSPPEKFSKNQGAGTGIIGLLEVIQSDLSKQIAVEDSEEQDALTNYNEVTAENKVTRAQKRQDVKFKTQEFKSLDKTVSDVNQDLGGTSTELSSIVAYEAKLRDRCIAAPETFKERKERRDAEIHGLKEALTILEGETAFLQRRRR